MVPVTFVQQTHDRAFGLPRTGDLPFGHVERWQGGDYLGEPGLLGSQVFEELGCGYEAVNSRLELTYQDQSIILDENCPSATLGRQPHNDIVVNDTRVSRSHARIEYNRGKFTLIDQSSNGTMVRIPGKKSTLIRREEIQLEDVGVIGLGRNVTTESEAAVHFAVRS